jgi:hypothetical protein
VGENDSNSTIVGDVLGTRAQRAKRSNNNEQKCANGDSLTGCTTGARRMTVPDA